MKYYAMIDGERRGPYELGRLAEAGVRPSTYVWCKGMPDWEKAEDVADVCRMFRRRIHDLMHPSSVEAERRIHEEAARPADSPSESGQSSPSRYDRFLKDDVRLPSMEEMEEKTDTTRRPTPMMAWAIIATILFFPPTGIAAIVFAGKSKKAWEKGEHKLAHDYSQAAKMWTGISFFLGLILYAFIFRFF